MNITKRYIQPQALPRTVADSVSACLVRSRYQTGDLLDDVFAFYYPQNIV